MKSSLIIVKIVLTIAIIVSIGTVLSMTFYFSMFENYPPAAVQQTITPTITLIPTITISEWKTYQNEKFGYKIKYPKTYSVEDKTAEVTSGDPSQLPWYFRSDYILSYIEFKDYSFKKTAFTLETVNTTDLSAIMNIGNENIKTSGSRKTKNFNIYLYSIDSGTNNMQVIIHNNKAYRFIHYLPDKNFIEIISNFEFIN